MKILTQNVMCWEIEKIAEFASRRQLIKRAVFETDADIIGFQEVMPHWEAFFKEDMAL